jgi:tight adherence protein C
MFTWIVALLVFASVFLLTLVLQRRRREARLRREALAVARETAAPAKTGGTRPLVQAFFRLLPALAAGQATWVPQPWGAQVEKKLSNQPLWRGRSAAEWMAAKELAAAGGLLFGLALGGDWLLTLGLTLSGFFLPDLWLGEQDRSRRRSLMRELPDVLDLLASCMDAGLGFEQALGVILERGRSGHLREEFLEMMRLIRMGQSRRDALQAMARRVDEQDFTTFVTALVQAERLGVSISVTLKSQAGQLRGKRSQQVEKQALEAPVKLLFPLIVFIFPVVFLILFGPIIVRFMQGF